MSKTLPPTNEDSTVRTVSRPIPLLFSDFAVRRGMADDGPRRDVSAAVDAAVTLLHGAGWAGESVCLCGCAGVGFIEVRHTLEQSYGSIARLGWADGPPALAHEWCVRLNELPGLFVHATDEELAALPWALLGAAHAVLWCGTSDQAPARVSVSLGRS